MASDKRPSSGYRKASKAQVIAEALTLLKPEPLLVSGVSNSAKAGVIEAIAECGDLELAAAACELTLAEVNTMARTDDSFRQQLTTARAKFLGERVKEVVKAGSGPKGDFRASTWLLERLDRNRFGPPKQVVDVEVTLSVSLMTEAQLLEAAGLAELQEAVDAEGEEVLPSGNGKTQNSEPEPGAG